jgi:hypothetical protein
MGWVYAAVIAGLLAVAGYLAWPTPGFELYLEQKIAKKDEVRDRVEKIVRFANARTDDFAKYQAKLALFVDGAKLDNPTPNEAFGGALKFGDLVTLKLGVKFEDQGISFSADFQADKMIAAGLAKVAEQFGVKRYYLVVQSFEPWPDSAGQHQMLVYLYPLVRRAAELPSRRGATDDELADLLARNMLESAADPKQNCQIVLCLADLSASLISLNTTGTAFDALLKGRYHPRCLGRSEESCFMQTEQDFLSALKVDPNNNHAHLGLGLIKISRAKALVDRASPYAVGEQLIVGFEHLASATRTNNYIRRLVESDDWRKLFGSTQEFQGLGLTREFIASAEAYQTARKAMIEGDYRRVVVLVDSIKNVPTWLTGHLTALRTQALLNSVSNRAEALKILSEFEAKRDTVDDWAWAVIYGISAAEWAQGDKGWEQRAADALDTAVRKAPDQVSTLEAMATQGVGLAILKRTSEAASMAENLARLMQGKDGAEYRAVWLTLGSLYALLGKFDEAAGVLRTALRYDAAYLKLVDTHKRFHGFVNWSGFKQWRLDVVPK